MSRSIHTLERDLWDLRRVRCGHRRDLAEVRARLAEEIKKKRRIKRRVIEERRAGDRPDLISAPEGIPINTSPERPGVHHGCSEADVRAVLAALPPGVSDGLSQITLTLGKEDQEEVEDPMPAGERDPFVGRLGFEILPGYWGGRVLGAYLPDAAAIEIYAYVFAPDAPHREWVELYLRLRTLATLVHEIGHHHDWMARVARGRWIADDPHKREIYAEGREHAWVREVVAPYLEQAYPRERAALDAWIARWGGLSLPLHELLDDPRTTAASGPRARLWGMDCALFALFEDTARGATEIAARLTFAREIHYAERYADARRVLAGVLDRDPVNAEAQVLEADIDVHEGQHERAAALCREVLARDPAYADAWQVLADAERERGRFAEARDAATAELGLREEGHYKWVAALRERARALLLLGDHAALAADLDLLDRAPGSAQSFAAALRAIMLVREARFEEALGIAREALAAPRVPFAAELAAAGLEAAVKLGRPADAPALPPRWREALRRRGFGAWVDALDAAAIAP